MEFIELNSQIRSTWLRRYESSGGVARKLGISPRTLGRLTSNCWLQTGEGLADVGIFVKHGSKSLCVPDYVTPAPGNAGWMYSEALLNVLSHYKVQAPCLEGPTAPACWPADCLVYGLGHAVKDAGG